MTTLTNLPKVLNLNLYRGDGFVVLISFRDKDGKAIILDGTWKAQIRVSNDDATVIDEFTINTDFLATGDIYLSLLGSQTGVLPPKSVWDFQQIPASAVGQPRTWYRGNISIQKDVTRT